MQRVKKIIELLYLICKTRLEESKEEIEEIEDENGEENCYSCEQCDNWYESRKDLEDHIRRRHTKYNCDQCDNWYESREDLEDHRRRRHSQECEEKLVCRNEKEQQKREDHRSGPV